VPERTRALILHWRTVTLSLLLLISIVPPPEQLLPPPFAFPPLPPFPACDWAERVSYRRQNSASDQANGARISASALPFIDIMLRLELWRGSAWYFWCVSSYLILHPNYFVCQGFTSRVSVPVSGEFFISPQSARKPAPVSKPVMCRSPSCYPFTRVQPYYRVWICFHRPFWTSS
jgi:hypothetical protein